MVSANKSATDGRKVTCWDLKEGLQYNSFLKNGYSAGHAQYKEATVGHKEIMSELE